MLVSNHASYLDGVILVAALPRPFAFVAKRELRDQFVAGRYLRRLGAEFVERFDVRRSVEDANRMADAVARGRSLRGVSRGHLRRRVKACCRSTSAPSWRRRGPRYRWCRSPSAATARCCRTEPGGRATRALQVEVCAPIPPVRDAPDLFAAAVQLREATHRAIARHLNEA